LTDQPPETERQASDPVSVRVTREVPAAKAAQFDTLLHEVTSLARTFEGHLGVDVLRPDAGGSYQIIFRFRTAAEYQAWTGSSRRSALIAKIDELLDDDTTGEVRSIDGWEGWFVTPGYAPPVPPRRWKMAVITLSALFPTVYILSKALRPIVMDWPLSLGLLLSLALTTSLMTWIVMPALTRVLGAWLRTSRLL